MIIVRKKNHTPEIAKEVWRQIESFAGYAFPKGHSASYAVESFQALYLKAYFPIEYMVATINNGGGFFNRALYLHEAKKHGAKVELPCINTSEYETIVQGDTIFLGLQMINGLESEGLKIILEERSLNGTFLSVQDFVKRVSVSLDQIRVLIRIDAFRFTSIPKKKLLWKAHFMLGKGKKTKPSKTLFYEPVREFKIPELHHQELEDAYTEIELLNFSVCKSPFELVETLPQTKLLASDLRYYLDQQVEIVGYLVHRKRTKTSRGGEMSFGTFLDLQGNWLDTVQFPEVNHRYKFQGYGCYLISGKVVDEFDVIMIETVKLTRLSNFNLEVQNPRLKA